MTFRDPYRGHEILNVKQCNTFSIARLPYGTRKFNLRPSDKKIVDRYCHGRILYHSHSYAFGGLVTLGPRAVLMYKVINLGQPVYLAPLFQKCQNRTSSRTHCRELIVPSSRTDVGLDSFWSQGTRLWNSIPRDIKNISSASKFKAAFGKYLMQRSCDVDCIYV